MSSESTKQPQKTKNLEETIANSKKHENMQIEEKVKIVERPEYVAKVIQKFDEIIKSNEKALVRIPATYNISEF